MALVQRDLIADLGSAVSSVESDVGSALGIATHSSSEQTSSTQKTTSTGNAKSTSSSKPASTAANTTSSAKSTASSTGKSTDSSSSSTDSAASSTITSISSTASITSTLSTSSRTPSTTLSPSATSSTPANPIASAPSTPIPSSDGGISKVGVAVAAVFAALIISGVLYLLWKYLPAARRYRDRKYQERSHRKGLSLDGDEEHMALGRAHEHMDVDDKRQGLGIAMRKFSFHTSPTYYPPAGGQQSHSTADHTYPTHYPSTADYHNVASPVSAISMTSRSPQPQPRSMYAAVPHSLQAGGSGSYSNLAYHEEPPRASQIGLAVPIRTPPRPTSSPEKVLPPLPLPSTGYGRDFSS